MQRRSDLVPSDDGVSIRYDVHGDGEMTLIFVHGCVATARFGPDKLTIWRRVTALSVSTSGGTASLVETERSSPSRRLLKTSLPS